jgi:hypothetical protein
MRMYLALIGLFVLFAGMMPSSARFFDPTRGLVAHYTFNECDARDDSGNGSHGRLFGSVSCWCGVEDDGLLLDGVNDYVEFHGAVNDYFGATDFTLSYYFKAEQYMIFQQSLFSKRADCTEYNMLDFLLDLNNKEIKTYLHETPHKYYGTLSPAVLTSGWHHIALVREGLKASTYINGQLQREGYRCNGIDLSNNAVLSFSNSPCVASGRVRRFRGVLDEVRVYDRALSKDEIEQLYRLYPVENAAMDCVSDKIEHKTQSVVKGK